MNNKLVLALYWHLICLLPEDSTFQKLYRYFSVADVFTGIQQSIGVFETLLWRINRCVDFLRVLLCIFSPLLPVSLMLCFFFCTYRVHPHWWVICVMSMLITLLYFYPCIDNFGIKYSCAIRNSSLAYLALLYSLLSYKYIYIYMHTLTRISLVRSAELSSSISGGYCPAPHTVDLGTPCFSSQSTPVSLWLMLSIWRRDAQVSGSVDEEVSGRAPSP